LKQLIKNTLAILSPGERKKLGMLALLDIVISIADIGFLALLLFIIHFYTQPAPSGKFSFLPAWFPDHHSLTLITVFFLFFGLKNLAGFLIYRAQCRFIGQTASRLSQNKLLGYLEGAYADYINVDSAVHIHKISHQPVEFCQHILGGIQQIITQSVLIALTIAGMLFFDARLFFLLFIILLPPVIAVFWLIKRKLKVVKKYARTSIEKALQYLQEALSGFVESNLYDKNDFFLRRYSNHQQEFNKYLSDSLIVQGMPNRMIEIFALLGLFILVAINNWSGGAHSTSIVTIGAFMAAAYKIIPGIVKIVNLSGQINTYEFTIHDLQKDHTGRNKKDETAAAKILRSLEFKNIRFRYNGKPVLSDLNFSVKPGDFLGISGHSGKGKTTILNLLLGFLKPDAGQIAINHSDADAGTRQQYWQNISYVKQESFLIHDSILRNIILDERVCDEQKLDQVIQATGLAELINSFPEKLNKIIKENGKNISGGQKQRITIARALYKNADLIILDEPFNELDEGSECLLLDYLKQLSQTGKLIILITHNKKSLSFCNKIVSLDV
jgi:ABC-type multidrug transport system fused ATPase/permease subunit